VTARLLIFDRDDRIALVEEDGRWTAPEGASGTPVWSRGDLVVSSIVIDPEDAPVGATWWTLAQLVGERPPFDPPELINLIRRQLPSCSA
jgi:hypothetical protein